MHAYIAYDIAMAAFKLLYNPLLSAPESYLDVCTLACGVKRCIFRATSQADLAQTLSLSLYRYAFRAKNDVTHTYEKHV